MDLRNHYRILVRPNLDDEPVSTLVEVILNDDGSIAATMEPVFTALDPAEVLHDLGRAIEGAALPFITPDDVKGHQFEDIPF